MNRKVRIEILSIFIACGSWTFRPGPERMGFDPIPGGETAQQGGVKKVSWEERMTNVAGVVRFCAATRVSIV